MEGGLVILLVPFRAFKWVLASKAFFSSVDRKCSSPFTALNKGGREGGRERKREKL